MTAWESEPTHRRAPARGKSLARADPVGQVAFGCGAQTAQGSDLSPTSGDVFLRGVGCVDQRGVRDPGRPHRPDHPRSGSGREPRGIGGSRPAARRRERGREHGCRRPNAPQSPIDVGSTARTECTAAPTAVVGSAHPGGQGVDPVRPFAPAQPSEKRDCSASQRCVAGGPRRGRNRRGGTGRRGGSSGCPPLGLPPPERSPWRWGRRRRRRSGTVVDIVELAHHADARQGHLGEGCPGEPEIVVGVRGPAATLYMRSRQVQNVPRWRWVRPRRARWKAWLWALASAGSVRPRSGVAPGGGASPVGV